MIKFAEMLLNSRFNAIIRFKYSSADTQSLNTRFSPDSSTNEITTFLFINGLSHWVNSYYMPNSYSILESQIRYSVLGSYSNLLSIMLRSAILQSLSSRLDLVYEILMFFFSQSSIYIT